MSRKMGSEIFKYAVVTVIGIVAIVFILIKAPDLFRKQFDIKDDFEDLSIEDFGYYKKKAIVLKNGELRFYSGNGTFTQCDESGIMRFAAGKVIYAADDEGYLYRYNSNGKRIKSVSLPFVPDWLYASEDLYVIKGSYLLVFNRSLKLRNFIEMDRDITGVFVGNRGTSFGVAGLRYDGGHFDSKYSRLSLSGEVKTAFPFVDDIVMDSVYTAEDSIVVCTYKGIYEFRSGFMTNRVPQDEVLGYSAGDKYLALITDSRLKILNLQLDHLLVKNLDEKPTGVLSFGDYVIGHGENLYYIFDGQSVSTYASDAKIVGMIHSGSDVLIVTKKGISEIDLKR